MDDPECPRTLEQFSGKWCVCILLIAFIFLSVTAFAGLKSHSGKSGKNDKTDTIFIKKGTRFILFGQVETVKKDTFFLISDTSLHPKIKSNAQQSVSFYDSIYKKLYRNAITRLLYPLAFRTPSSSLIPDKVQAMKNDIPFMPFKGKIIRKIRIKTLAPFGTRVSDTTAMAVTGIGRALNSIHINTHVNVIRKNLLIKEGKQVDPVTFADNERIIREMSFIDNVQTIVSPVGNSDSVDVTIVTKDVWSIGADITTITPSNAIIHLYDANFLGLGDLLGTNMSFQLQRSPFMRFDQVSYQYNNIDGSFIDCMVGYKHDDEGNENINVSFNRVFYSVKTKWAGGGYFQYYKTIHEAPKESEEPLTYNHDFYFWGGRSFLLNKSKRNTRFVLMESYYQRLFTSRPAVTINTNLGYYNTTQLFTGIALSSNNYYLSDYVFQFGKTENIPHGSLFQLTLGPEFSQFYTRVYGGSEVSLGNFFSKFGYVSGRIRFGGYMNKGSAEDEVLKVGFRYFTPLLHTPDQRYRFRTFLYADYKYGFNFRSNNTGYFSIASIVNISKEGGDSVFTGAHGFSLNLATVMYTPWYFYGFKFGIMAYVQGGIIATKGESLVRNPFYTGIGLGLLIKNDNLIFPTFMITAFVYPNVASASTNFQFKFINDIGFSLPDFNASGPHTENLQN